MTSRTERTEAAKALGSLGGKRNTKAQREARLRNLELAREQLKKRQQEGGDDEPAE